jgi:hypothetical protein
LQTFLSDFCELLVAQFRPFIIIGYYASKGWVLSKAAIRSGASSSPKHHLSNAIIVLTHKRQIGLESRSCPAQSKLIRRTELLVLSVPAPLASAILMAWVKGVAALTQPHQSERRRQIDWFQNGQVGTGGRRHPVLQLSFLP